MWSVNRQVREAMCCLMQVRECMCSDIMQVNEGMCSDIVHMQADRGKDCAVTLYR